MLPCGAGDADRAALTDAAPPLRQPVPPKATAVARADAAMPPRRMTPAVVRLNALGLGLDMAGLY